jgi:3-hydroxybutyryl-CoA dehydratase
MINPDFPFHIGDKDSLTKEVTEKDVDSFAKLVGDYNPLHMDEEYARRHRFGNRIAHGGLIFSLISAVLGTRLPGPGTIYLSQSIKFVRPVRLGDTMIASVRIVEINPENGVIKLETICVNQNKENVAEGEALVLVDR